MSAKKSQKGRKLGRNKDWCKAYRHSNQRERNKARRLLKHFNRYGYANASAVHCYNNLLMSVKPKNIPTVSLEKPVPKGRPPAQKMPPVRARVVR